MRLMNTSLLLAASLAFTAAPLAWADSPPLPIEPTTTWECPQADGIALYTNKEKAGCRPMTLKPLSVVPNIEHMPIIPRTIAAGPHYQTPSYSDRSSGGSQQMVPDWARDWRARLGPGDSMQEDVCGLYAEWLSLVQKTRGGFFYGMDPSYGGDITGRNQRGPSYSFYDNARYIALSRIFGTGFVPVGCQ
jgi:hypothetical protein